MKKAWGIRMAGCLCIGLCYSVAAYANVGKSPNPAARVTAKEDYSHIAVSQVEGYVNIREQANTSSKVVGKVYNHCAAEIQEAVEGEGGTWYRIRSGTVTGYIKAQYFITGGEAQKLAQSIGREFLTVDTESLRLRERPDLNSKVLTLLSQEERYVVQGEEGIFYKVEVDADLTGYVAKEYCKTQVEFDQAVSLEEEQQKMAEEASRKQEAMAAMAALEQARQGAADPAWQGGQPPQETYIEAHPNKGGSSPQTSAPVLAKAPSPASPQGPLSGPGGDMVRSAEVVSATRAAIVAYAKQFLGCPYVYGGTSLTNGADCSGFTQGVYAHFDIETWRSSRDQAERGKGIPVESAQPGDLLFYASGDYINHVALYIGGGQVIHASNATTGIIISPYNYRTPCKAVTFLD